MLGLLGQFSLGAGRSRFASGGLTPIAILSASLLLAACQVPQHPSQSASKTPPAAVDPIETAAPAPKSVPLDTTPAVAHADSVMPASLHLTGDCVVDLYLYDRDGGLKVTYVEARSRSAEPTPTTRCLKSLLERPTASIQ